MGINTNLNQSPYFDDFNENKNFHRVLFRPGYSVQARELTQLQTILQNQVERFAGEVFIDGTVVTGVGLTTDQISFVKLRDKDANNRVILLNDFYESGAVANLTITGATTGMTAKLVTVTDGSEISAPDYLTVHCHYTNSGSNNTTKAFSDNETLIFRRSSNSEYFVAANTITSEATGQALKGNISDGIIYHKGNFIRCPRQSTIIGKYTTTPSKKLGIRTVESTVDSNQDSSLLDNASGATNFSAPGADRLKLNPILETYDLSVANTDNFFIIATITNGSIEQRNTETVYSEIGSYIAERMHDTTGNFVVDPFNIRVREHLNKTNSLGRYTSAEGGDSNLLVAEIEKGRGYVNGYQVELNGSKYLNVNKATTVFTKDALSIGQAYGSYVFAEEVVGTWDFSNLKQVVIRDAAQNAITGKNFGASSPSGTQIGTAKVRGVQYHSGTPGTYNGQFRIYIFDIQMNSGKSFADARGLYINNASGPDSFADIVLEASGDAKVQEQGLSNLVFKLGQKGTKTLKDASDIVDTQFVVRKRLSAVSFDTAGQASYGVGNTHPGGTEAIADTGLPITNIDERNTLIVSTTATTTAPHTGYIQTISGNTITGVSTTFESSYQVGDMIQIVDGGNTYNERISEITNNTSLKVYDTIAVTRSGATLAHKTSFPTGYHWDLSGNGTISATTSTVSVDLQQANLSSGFTAEVYYDVIRSSANPTKKTVYKDKYVHINTGSHSASADGPWGLGVSDAFEITAVYKGGNTTVDTTGTDVTNDFILDNGQKDGFYGVSKLQKNETSSLDTVNTGLMVKLSYFDRDTSTGYGFLSVDSYADIIDDANTANTTAITTQEIPIFTSPTSGKKIDLRDAVDFRPKYTNTVTPSGTGTVASAPTNPADPTVFSYTGTSGVYVPTPDQTFQCDAQFYLPRKDRVIVSQRGTFEVVQGIPDLTPKTPVEPSSSMTLGVIDVPAYPSLAPSFAKNYNRPDYGVKLALENNRRYTMSDLRAVEGRVKNLEYYSTLNALETTARNQQLFGTTGIERFKNGFLVDNFEGHNIADTNNPYYRASVDRPRGRLRPLFNRSDVSYRYATTITGSNVRKTGNIVSLDYTDESMINQDYASKLRNPVQELLFNWRGQVILDPEADNTPDITTLPDIQVDFDGIYESMEQIARAARITNQIDFGTWRTTGSEFRRGNTIRRNQQRIVTETTISAATESFSLGNFVTDVSVREYMRSRLINFTGVRMKPNTRVYPYFDDEKVFNYCRATDSNFSPKSGAPGQFGGSLVTDSTGTVYGQFRIPNDSDLKFRTGTKRFLLTDIDDPIVKSEVATTSAHGEFTSNPLDVTQRGTTVDITFPQISKRQTVQRRQQWTVLDRDNGWQDPIAQTFSVNVSGSTDGVFISKIDLFFGNKSSTLPITLQIREVETGFPVDTIVPYGQKTLQASEVNTSADGSTATTFTFDNLVFLKNNTDYAFVVIPGGNSDDYTVWCAGLGENDTITNTLISKQPYTGVLFTSSNDNTWSPIQSEDMKFQMYRAKFTSSTGTLYLENEEQEFFDYDNYSGAFVVGETAIAESVLTFSNNDSISVGTVLRTQITDSANTLFANGTVRQIVSSGSGSVTVKVDNFGTFPTTASSNTNNIYVGSTWIGNTSAFTANTAQGTVQFIDNANQKLYLTGSAGGFANGYIRGQSSGASARVTAVNDLPLNTIVPKVPHINYAGTSAGYSYRPTTTSGVISSTYENIELAEENNFYDGEKKIYSKSNEDSLSAVGGTTKSGLIKGTISSTRDTVSPILDVGRANAIVVENIINNDSSDEHKNLGNALMRYTSNPVELDDGQEAEDLIVYLGAYKPQGTDINVYVKVLNGEDGESLDTKDFTPLRQITASNTYSEGLDGTDIKDFEYGLYANTDGSGYGASGNTFAYLNSGNNNVITYNGNDGSVYHTFKTFAIKIVFTSSGSNVVPLVADMRAIALQK
jgi:hypothetical protein